MSNPTSAGDALRDLLPAHVKQHVWLPTWLMLVSAVALLALVREILHVRAGAEFVPPEFRTGITYKAVISWAVSNVCAYIGGFVKGRLYAA
jgi:hypothetical protein